MLKPFLLIIVSLARRIVTQLEREGGVGGGHVS